MTILETFAQRLRTAGDAYVAAVVPATTAYYAELDRLAALAVADNRDRWPEFQAVIDAEQARVNAALDGA